MAVLGPCINVNMNGNTSNIHNQLSKSLERILEDAYLSGELKLSGRKLKDFPKPVRHDLRDTVVADLSKNRFTEVPDEVSTFVYLEKLLISQNVINRVPDSVGCLQSLTYLDLSSNQLSELPREICQMPLQILLVQDNVLTSLPKELGKMHTLAELDASRNRLTQVPMTLGDCTGLRALDLSNNQLGLLPLQITYLKLEYLDVSCNCISSLPLEFRNMHSLVTLNLDYNPLVSPPTTVCMRGRVHIFKYLENLANKDSAPAHKKLEDTRRTKHNSYLSSGQHNHHHIVSGNNTIDCLRHKPRHVIDSGYSTDGVDKRWSNEAGGEAGGGSGRSTPSTPSTLSPNTALSRLHSLSSESPLAPATPILSSHRISPESMTNGDDKNKLAQQQTYRQYKEALRQQRQQDIYRPRTDQSSPDLNSPSNQSPVHLPKSTGSPQSPLTNGHASNSPTYYNRTLSSNSSLSISPNSSVISTSISPNSSVLPNSPLLHSTPRRYQNGEKEETKRPVQKVVPSRNNKVLSPTETNINIKITDTYAKPMSPTKSPTIYNNGLKSNIPKMLNGDAKLVTTSVSYVKGSTQRSGTKMLWSKEVMEDKLSFTMKREFDKQKEETDLLQQLRVILESRLKMQLPEQLAPVLSDGVVLCHLANHVRPRSVASVHVPSPAQPKLTMARCRRNVDNFLEACRKIGVEEEAICSTEDILELRGDHDTTILPLVRTVLGLLAHATAQRPQKDVNNYLAQCNQSQCYYNSEEYTDQSDISYGFNGQSDDSNPQSDQSENQVEYASEFVNETPMSYKIDYKQTRYDEERYISNFSAHGNQYFAIEEKDEYQVDQNIETIECYTTHYENNANVRKRPYRNKNKVQFVVPFNKENGLIRNDRLEIYDIDEVDYIPEEIEERYDREKLNLEIPNNLNLELNRANKEILDTQVASIDEEKRFLITCLCLGGFFMSVVILYLFPL